MTAAARCLLTTTGARMLALVAGQADALLLRSPRGCAVAAQAMLLPCAAAGRWRGTGRDGGDGLLHNRLGRGPPESPIISLACCEGPAGPRPGPSFRCSSTIPHHLATLPRPIKPPQAAPAPSCLLASRQLSHPAPAPSGALGCTAAAA